MKKRSAILLLISAMLLAGCESTDPEILEYVLNCIREDGYITEEHSLLHELTQVSAAIPDVMSHDYVYSNEDGELFCVRIRRVQEGETECEVEILYGIEMGEYVRTNDGKTKHIPYIEDGYESRTELTYAIPAELLDNSDN